MSAPITEKHGETGENEYFEYGVSSMQGWRIDMEDAHLACLDAKTEHQFSGIYGVFDGHGGREVAQFCSRHLLEVWKGSKGLKEGKMAESLAETFLGMDDLMRKESSYKELNQLAKRPDRNPLDADGEDGEQMRDAQAQVKQLLMGFRQGMNKTGEEGDDDIRFDDDAVDTLAEAVAMGSDAGERNLVGPSAGCTAVVAVVVKDEIIVANAGDSRCVFCRKGKAVAMSRDHKPLDHDEADRIQRAGGFVTDGRVNGSLNLSRALGDMEYKQNRDLNPRQHAVTAFPEIFSCRLHKDDEFIILACDGIWDVMTNQEAVDFVRERNGKLPLQKICEEICDYCLAPDTAGVGKGCDNMTVMVVNIKPPLRPSKEFSEPRKVHV